MPLFFVLVTESVQIGIEFVVPVEKTFTVSVLKVGASCIHVLIQGLTYVKVVDVAADHDT